MISQLLVLPLPPLLLLPGETHDLALNELLRELVLNELLRELALPLRELVLPLRELALNELLRELVLPLRELLRELVLPLREILPDEVHNMTWSVYKEVHTRTSRLQACTGLAVHAYYIKSRSFFGLSGLFISRHSDPTVAAAWTPIYATRPGMPTCRVL